MYIVCMNREYRDTASVPNLCWLKENSPTCIIDKKVQSGFSFQEVFSKTANRFETPKITLHEHHLVTVTLLWGVERQQDHMSTRNEN